MVRPSPIECQRRWLAHRREATGDGSTRVGIAASFTAEPLEAFLGVRLLDAGLHPTFSFADYNQIYNVCFDPAGTVGEVDYLIILWRAEDMFRDDVARAAAGDGSAVASAAQAAGQLGDAIAGLCTSVPYPVIVSIPPAPLPIGVDRLDSRSSIPLHQLHAAVTQEFLGALSGSAARIVDLGAWERQLGWTRTHDTVKQFAYKQPYSSEFYQLLGSHLGDVIDRETRPVPKCIVLDADNTLWGGILGEDGIGGLALGSSFPGEAYRQFQFALKALRGRGVLLAVASKNNFEDVAEVFSAHDDMALSADDIAVWRVNWGAKSESIKEIAAQLNIGEDSLIFIDDSSYEIAEVQTALPHVTCLQVPEEIAELPDLLAASGLFRNMQVSTEDLKRTEMIISERARKTHGEGVSREDFLRSLELVVEYVDVQEEHVGRVAQLTNKTNQFNLTTIRRTEAQVRSLVQADDYLVRAIKVSDKFGDYGLVGVAVLRGSGTEWEVDTLLMSCRVLARGIETAFLSRLMQDAHGQGALELVGRYEPTQKNILVAELYPTHGFAEVEPGVFRKELNDLPTAPDHIQFS